MRNEALQKLAKIRINLANELAELVNSNNDLEAEFNSGYSATTEELLELGDKIVKLGFILMHMPQDEQPQPTRELPSVGMSQVVAGATMEPYYQPEEQPSWDRFIHYVKARQLNPSAGELSRLLRIDVQTAMRCVAHFAALLERDYNGTIGTLNSLGAQLKINTNGSLNLLRELFNLQGDIAVHVYERLKATTT